MQPWQIKALKLEVSALDDLNGFVRENALYLLMAIICLLVVLLTQSHFFNSEPAL